MKRSLLLLAAVLLFASCHDASRDPVITGYRVQQVNGMGLGRDGMTADLVLELDVDNPSKARYTVESLQAVLYRNGDTARFAEATLQGSPEIGSGSGQTVLLPLSLQILRPLALLSGFQRDFDLSQYCADIDLTISKGAFKKRIQKERMPLDQLKQLLENQHKESK